MPHLPARELAQARLARIIRRATREQHRRLEDAMGWPPDVARIPAQLWHDIEREQAESSRPLLAMIFLTAGAALGAILQKATGQQVSPEELGQEALRYGQQRSLQLASVMADATRDKLTAAATDARQALQVQPEAIARKEFRERVGKVFSPERAAAVGVTDTGFAARGGGNAVIGRFQAENPGRTILKIWRHRERIVFGQHPCPLCAPLVGTSENEWAGINPAAEQGPPLHVLCDCNWEGLLITKDEEERLPMTPPQGWDRPYRDQFTRIRDSRGPADR